MPVQSTPTRPRPGLLERVGSFGAISGIAVVLVLGVLLVSDGQLQSASHQLLRSGHALELAATAERQTVDAETSARAYLLTGRSAYIPEARRSFRAATATLAQLSYVVRRTSDQQQRVEDIRAATARLGTQWIEPSLAQTVRQPRPYNAFVDGERTRLELQHRYALLAARELTLESAQVGRVHVLHRRVWYAGLGALFAIPLLLFLFRAYVGIALVRPVRALAALATRVERGEEGAVGDVRGPREIAQLQDAFNRMSSMVGQRRRELLEHAPITIWEAVGCELRWISPYWRTMAGEGAVEPTTIGDIDALIHPEDRERVAAQRQEAMRSQEAFDYRYRIVRRDGQIRWLWTRAKPMGTIDGEPRVIGFTLDVTEDERTRHELAHAQRLESIGHLAGGVAHDFNNLLTVIAGYAALAQMRLADPERLEEPLAEIMAAAQRASALTRQLLMFSREQPFELQPLDLNDVVRSVIPMLDRLIEERISVLCSSGDDLPPIRFDRGQLEQVIVNLAVNARDAIIGNGQIVIKTSAVGEGAAQSVRLSVTDDGTGMDAATIEHIFDPFFTTKPPGSGTGLGLSTVHGIIARGGGHIEVDSQPGRGTTFTLYFPAAEELVAAA
jgi:signal transduction histidine kinase